MPRALRSLLLCLATAALAGGARAEAAAGTARPALRLAIPDTTVQRPFSRASAVETPLASRTEVDHRFGREGPVAQAGYLCGIGGLGPDSAAPGGGPASLWNHQGTFLGAKLGYGFR